jgi:hypothetical protein
MTFIKSLNRAKFTYAHARAAPFYRRSTRLLCRWRLVHPLGRGIIWIHDAVISQGVMVALHRSICCAMACAINEALASSSELTIKRSTPANEVEKMPYPSNFNEVGLRVISSEVRGLR